MLDRLIFLTLGIALGHLLPGNEIRVVVEQPVQPVLSTLRAAPQYRAHAEPRYLEDLPVKL